MDRLAKLVVRILPKRVLYWAVYQVFHDVTQGYYNPYAQPVHAFLLEMKKKYLPNREEVLP